MMTFASTEGRGDTEGNGENDDHPHVPQFPVCL